MTHIHWSAIDWEARKGFFTTYKKGTWDKGGVGKAIFAYSLIVYIAAVVIGMYAINKKIFEFGYALPELVDKTKRRLKLFYKNSSEKLMSPRSFPRNRAESKKKEEKLPLSFLS